MNPQRILFVGDIQGCSEELALLLERAGFARGRDRLIPVGDTINRGPDAPGVLSLLNEARAEPIVGNHELALLALWQSRSAPDWVRQGASAYVQLAAARRWDTEMARISTWPAFRRGPGWIAVHAGLHPTQPPEETDPSFLTHVRYCDASGRRAEPQASAPLEAPAGFRPWFDFYRGAETVVFGHWARRGLVVQDRIRGLDTGCVYGRSLTGLWWPEDRLVQVAAQRAYAVPGGKDDAFSAEK